MAGNAEATHASGVTDADIWAALDAIDPGARAEESNARERGTEEPDTEDIGHGAEVTRAIAPETAGGDNAGDEEEEAEEAPEQTEEEADEESAEETEEAEEAPPVEEEEAQPKGFQEMERRIHKLTARSKDLQEENAALRTQLESAQPIVLQPTEADPLVKCNSEADVAEMVKHARTLRAWAIENFDGGDCPQGDGSAREMSAIEVRQMSNRCDDIINVHAAARRNYLAQRAQYDAICRESYPELYDAKSEASQIAWTFLNQNPEILRLPQYALIIGDAIRGGRLRQEEAKAKKARTAPATVGRPGGPKLAPRAISPAAAKTVRSNGASQLHQRFMQTGSKKDLEAYLTRSLGG